jgi:hypothetical protein
VARMSYPIAYAQDPPEQRSRLTVFLRVLMVIPHTIWSFFYAIGFMVAVVIAWFAIVFTGRFPRGLYDFIAGFVRFYHRYLAYFVLVTDRFPPFDGGAHPEYPVQIPIAPPAAEYSRVKAFFRLILAIPIMIVQYAMQLWVLAVAIAIWFVAVITGHTARSLMDAIRLPMAYITRSNGYFYLLTETWPPLDEPAQIQPATPAPALDVAPEAPPR